MADGRKKRSAIVVALTLGVSVVVPLAVTTLGAVGAALFVAAKYNTSETTVPPARATAENAPGNSGDQEAISTTAG
ncbi:hypothetical protein [Allokutzneria oryzae]|uniref:Uncharacterized protein n=1 Tax=Allokutzneria oryzae TaxID=1378989 RepID=A0ABV6A688_9PSEU